MIHVNIDKSNKCNGEYSLYVSFEYDNRIVEHIRTISERYWDKDNKIWELPFKALQTLVEGLPTHEFELTGTYVSKQKKKAVIPEGFSFKTEPYEHQIDGFNYGLENDRWLLGDEMGLGKTKQVIDIAVAKKMECGYKHCLIICGVNGLKWNWRNEVSIHSNESAYILGQRRTSNNKLVIGSNADKADDLANIKMNDNYFLITNIESLREEVIVDKLQALCANGTIGMIAFDECHKAKNPLSDQGKGILKLHADTMIAMTGTPLMNNPFDLYIILKWLGYEKHAFGAFKRHYADFGGFGGYQVTGYKNLDELEDRLDDIMLRRKKEEVLDLPDKMYIDEFVEMSDKQRKIYEEVTSEIKTHIDEIKTANNPLAELIRMRQATGYTGILSSTIKESAKLDRMEELVEEAVESGKKVVIFSNWTQMTDVIYERLSKKFRGLCLTGETKDDERQWYVNQFQTVDYINFMVGTTGAMGTGLTLTAGTVEIFVDEPWNMALKEQAVDRCHRIGQKDNLTIYTLMCKDTIDERIHQIVEKKGMMADAIVDGNATMSKEEILDFLLS